MDCADYIEKLGNSPSGNFLSAKYKGDDKPDSVTVKGTSDTQSLRGNSGVWISGSKYTSMKQTLQLNKNGSVMKECSYNDLGLPSVQDAAISNFVPVADPAGFVNVTWTTTKEVAVSVYIIDRKPSGGDYEEGVQAVFPDENQVPKPYNVADTPPGSGTWIYRCRARFEDGSVKDLGESSPVTI